MIVQPTRKQLDLLQVKPRGFRVEGVKHMKKIKYEMGPTYKHAREYDIGLKIYYFSNGKARLRLNWLQNPAQLDMPIVDVSNRFVTMTVGKERVDGLMNKLTEAQFYVTHSRIESNVEDGRFQRLKTYRPIDHEVIGQNYAFPELVREVIAEIREPFEKFLDGYTDPNERFMRRGLILPVYIKQGQKESDEAKLDWDEDTES